jgi:hypothetical protein
MAFDFKNPYAPPGIYTETKYENPLAGNLSSLNIPMLIGPGNEILSQSGLEVVRGSSSTIDQTVPTEDVTGRAVLDIAVNGTITLGAWDGASMKCQVRNFPIVTGDGSGTSTTKANDVVAFINDIPIVVLSVDGVNGIVELATVPEVGDEVRITYFFNRTDADASDDVSDQVSTDGALLRGSVGENFTISEGNDDAFILSVDGAAAVTITLPPGVWEAAQVAASITAAGVKTLSAATFVNYLGEVCISLSADLSISVGAGTANAVLGFNAGAATSRTSTFHVFQGPIVDGSNGGVTSTNPSHVVATVNGAPVSVASVDGANRAVTLSVPPAVGDTVLISYKWNSWQDTFDYLANIGVLAVSTCGISTGRSDYVQGVDFVLKGDTLLWGTAALVATGAATVGTTEFGTVQVSAALVDAKAYLQSCAPVTNTAVTPANTSRTVFKLQAVPTTGNGRNSPLGSSLFQTVSNSRIDVPTDRPDLVTAYWGFSPQDALVRGSVPVLKVDSASAEITLADPIPVGAVVYATFYYNSLKDEEYTLTCASAGASGSGTYSVADSDGNALFSTVFGSRGAGLAEDPVFPSGSVRMPDARHEVVGGDGFTGPLEEDVTVEFIDKFATPPKWTYPGPGPFWFAGGTSDDLELTVVGNSVTSALTIDLSKPSDFTGGGGSCAVVIGSEVEYDDAAAATHTIVAGTDDGIHINVDGVSLDATAAAGSDNVSAYATALNAESVATAAEYNSSGRFSGWVCGAGDYDTLSFHWNGSTSGVSAVKVCTIAADTYATPSDLAVAVQTALLSPVAPFGDAADAPSVAVSANNKGQLVFAVTTSANDVAGGVFEFIGDGGTADFCVLAGIDSDTATMRGQTKILAGCPVAKQYTITGAGELMHDRLLLRNRLLGGGNSIHPASIEEQASVEIISGNALSFLGLDAGSVVYANCDAVIRPATMTAQTGWSGGQNGGQPVVTFYDGTNPSNADNTTLKFNIDGYPVEVGFGGNGAGVDVAFGPAVAGNGSVIDLIATAIAAVHDDFASNVAVMSAGLVSQEGATLRITSAASGPSSSLSVSDGTANGVLGFTSNSSASRSSVTTQALANAANSHGADVSWLQSWTGVAGSFSGVALADAAVAADGKGYLYIQGNFTGTAASVAVDESLATSALLPGTGLLAEDGDGAVGEAGVSGFTVKSSSASGSGSADDSTLQADGLGSDGVVGQTYRDAVTGLSFTILPLEGGNNYTDGGTANFSFEVRSAVTCDANIPVNAIPGISLVVSNTVGITEADTAIIECNERGGAEPVIGDRYYVSYDYSKRDYSPRVFTRMSSIERAFGLPGADSPTSLAAYLMLLNGASAIGVKQVQKDAGSTNAGVSSYTSALDELEGLLPGRIRPSVLVPLVPYSLELAQYLSVHCAIQSDIRHRAERTAILGFQAGTQPSEAADAAKSVGDARIRLLYPDMLTVTTTDADGRDSEQLIDGRYLAAMMAARASSPNRDVATPWTGTKFVGTNGLSRVLDPVTQNQVAAAGVSVCEDRPPFIKMRHGLTTDMSSIMTKTPTVAQISDFVQQQSRDTLEGFIGVKFLPQILSQVEGRISTMFKTMVQGQIVAGYTGIRASLDPNDPTAAKVEAFYQPVFPLLYIVLTFNIRASL